MTQQHAASSFSRARKPSLHPVQVAHLCDPVQESLGKLDAVADRLDQAGFSSIVFFGLTEEDLANGFSDESKISIALDLGYEVASQANEKAIDALYASLVEALPEGLTYAETRNEASIFEGTIEGLNIAVHILSAQDDAMKTLKESRAEDLARTECIAKGMVPVLYDSKTQRVRLPEDAAERIPQNGVMAPIPERRSARVLPFGVRQKTA